MKTFSKLYLMAAAALGLAACNSEEDFLAAFNDDPNAVHFSVQIGEGNIAQKETKVDPFKTIDPVFEAGDKISVEAGKQSAVNYTLTDGAWVPETGKYLLWETDKNLQFRAYYPVVTGASLTDFAMPASYADAAALEAADYMTGSTTSNKAEKVSLVMERKMARVIVQVVDHNNQYESFSVSSVTLAVNTKGYKNGQPEAGQMTVTTLPQEKNTKFYALVAPTTADPDAVFLTIKGTDEDGVEHTHTVTGLEAMTAGISYTYQLTIGKDKAEVSSVTVKDWATGDVIGEGEAEIETTPANPRPYADPTTLTIYTAAAGDISADATLITTALAGGKTLKVDGPVNDADLKLIKGHVATLDLSKATMTAMGSEVFKQDVTLESITLPEGLTSMGQYAFQECSKLKDVNLPSTLTSLGAYAFWKCTALTKVTCLGDVTSIGDSAFYMCNTTLVLDLSANTKAPSAGNDYIFANDIVTIYVKDINVQLDIEGKGNGWGNATSITCVVKDSSSAI